MSIAKQRIPINFSQGLNLEADSFQSPQGSFLELDNVVFNHAGALNKRYGYNVLNTSVEPGGSIPSGKGLGVFNNELLLFDGNSLNTYLPATQKWISKGTAISVNVSTTAVAQNADAMTLPDAAYLSGWNLICWNEGGTLHYSLIDAVSGAQAMTSATTGANILDPRICILNNKFHIFGVVGTDIFSYSLDPTNPTALTAGITTITDFNNTNSTYDVKTINGKIWIAYNSNSTSRVVYRSWDGTTLSSTKTDGTSSNEPNKFISLFTDSSNNVCCLYGSASKVYLQAMDSSAFTFPVIEKLIENLGARVPLNGCGREASFISSHSVYSLYYTTQQLGYDEQVRRATFTVNTLTVSGLTTLMKSVTLLSKPIITTSFIAFFVHFNRTAQNTVFFVKDDGTVVGKISPLVAGGQRANKHLPEITSPGSNQYLFASEVKEPLQVVNGKAYFPTGITSTVINFNHPLNFVNAKQNNNLIMVGGLIQNYDGASFKEHNFNAFPNVVSYTPSAGGSLSVGTYSYLVVYEWTDNYNQIHRSTPSLPGTVVTSAGGGSIVTLVISTLMLTKKSNVRIVIYRTQVNGSVYQRVTDIASPTLNDTTVATISYADSASDASVAANDYIYSDGSQNSTLYNIAPPSCSIICTHKDRIFLSGTSNPNEIWYSKESVDGEATNFAAELTILTDERGGAVTALASLESSLVIFKQSSIYILLGDGPNNTGNQNDYGDPQLVTSDVGCINQLSVEKTSQGIMFQSQKGLYLFNGQSVSRIGSPVQDYSTYTIVSANLVPAFNEMRFATSDGFTIVYNYYYNQWTRFTNQAAVDAVLWNGTYVYLLSNGTVYQESTATFTDNGTFVPITIITSWMSFAQMQGYQLIYRAIFLATYKSAHNLKLSYGYNMDPAFNATQTINATSVIGSLPVYQVETHLAQKCQSFRIKIEDTQDGTPGESLSLSTITLEVGIKQGLNKLPSTQTF